MAINERSRHDLFARLEEVLGKEHATVLMEHLPPVGWADVTTKHDLDQLEIRLQMRLDAFEERFVGLEQRSDSKLDALKFELLANFRAELNSQTRLMIFSMATTILAVAGVALAAAQLV